MEFDTQTIMMFFFIVGMILSMWKIYAFLPNEQLPDDDTTPESQEELQRVILKVIKEHDGELSANELFELVKKDGEFDSKHFWRFNLNRLNQELNLLYIKHPHAKRIKDLAKLS